MSRRFRSDDDAPKVAVTRESFKEALKIFKYVRPYRWYFIGGMIFLFLSSVIFMVFPYLIGLLIDIAQGKSEMNFTLKEVGIALFGVLIVQAVFSYSRVLMFANVSERGTADIRKGLYRRMLSLPIMFFEENKMGDLISRLTSDVDRLYSTFSVTLAEFLRQIITLIVGVIFLAVTTPKLSLVMLLTIPVVVVCGIVFGKFIRKYSKERQKKLADSNAILGESLQSITVVKAFVSEFFEIHRYNRSIRDVVKIAMKYAHYRALFAVFIIVIMFGALFFIIWRGAMMVQDGTMTAGMLVSFVSYTFIISGAIASLGSFYPELVGALGATERIREILKTDGELELEDADENLPALDINGEIAFNDVHFAYPTRKDIPVLKGLNMEIHKGQKVALVGPSGAGKSTIVQLLLRFYELTSGSITVDGRNIEDFDVRQLRNQLAIVPQDVILFGGTIKENILYGKEHATDEEVNQAAMQSNSLEFIESFPEGFDTIVGERGIKLSGGQRQRIAIARALLKDPKILLLDEATSSLDAESEKVVQDALETLMEGRTSIIIAHRLSTVRDVDTIYVLNDGVISEKGSHENLMLLENGLYRNLAGIQFQGV